MRNTNQQTIIKNKYKMKVKAVQFTITLLLMQMQDFSTARLLLDDSSLPVSTTANAASNSSTTPPNNTPAVLDNTSVSIPIVTAAVPAFIPPNEASTSNSSNVAAVVSIH